MCVCIYRVLVFDAATVSAVMGEAKLYLSLIVIVYPSIYLCIYASIGFRNIRVHIHGECARV